MEHTHPLLVIGLIAVLAPLISELPVRFRVPGVVLEIVFGIIVGPQVLGWVRPTPAVDLLWKLGMVFLFLLAGMEIDFSRLKGRPFNLAVRGWCLSLALALAAAFVLYALGLVSGPVIFAIALTTTAVGTLLPILRDAGELSRGFGRLTLAAGAMGEFGPLLLLSLLPFEPGKSVENNTLVLLAFVSAAVLAALLVVYIQPPKFLALLKRHLHKTSQLPVRLAILLVAVFIVLATELELELLVGAFAAGLILGAVMRGDGAHEEFRHKLDGVGFGFLIPVFFVVTGVMFDVNALFGSAKTLSLVPLFMVLFLVARGVPAILYRHELNHRDRLALALYSASALPVVIATAQIGVATGRMTSDIAAALIGAGLLSLFLLYPQLAAALRAHAPHEAPEVKDEPPAGAPAAPGPNEH